MNTRPSQSFFGSRKPSHTQMIKQLVAENTMLKQRLMAADKEQRSIDYWKAAVGVVTAEMHQLDQTAIKEDTPYADVIEIIAKNIVAKLEEAEKTKNQPKHIQTDKPAEANEPTNDVADQPKPEE